VKLGMLTACLPTWSLDQIAEFATDTGYQALEVAVWPDTGGRAFEAAHLPVATFGAREQEDTLSLMDRLGLEISALAYYENNLHPDAQVRAGIQDHLRSAVDAASSIGVPYVGTFIGRDPSLSVTANQREAERTLPGLVEYAGERNVKLIIENCVMEGWHPDGYPGNIAYSPELWEWMFDLGLYLNWDPSHLMWLGIDPVETILPYAEHIVHAQAKDIELDELARQRYGFFGIVEKDGDPWATGWWRYRIPGRGQVDWGRVVDRLYEAGFAGTLSVEHEDPLWGGNEVKVTQGLQIAHRTLRPLILEGPAEEHQ
jgi:sugar phosphate isomerase/epimerase